MKDIGQNRIRSLFSEEKSRNFTLTDSSKTHPHGIIANGLKEILKNYPETEKYELVDYLSEWTSEYKDTPIDAINRALTIKFYEESKKNYLNMPNEFEAFIPRAFENHASTPEAFMEYLLGEEKWRIVKDRIENRTMEERINDTNRIKKWLESTKESPRGKGRPSKYFS